MTFTSLQFYAFLPIVYLIYYFTEDRWRWMVLLVASYCFYASFMAPYLLAVLLMVTWISYTCGLCIGSHQEEQGRKRWFQIGVFACVTILAILKYIPFLEIQTSSLFGLNRSLPKIIISIGVSYFTFQAISYLADIYLELEEPETHFGRYALYMAFFPKLLQGPIERAGDLLPQLKRSYQFDYDTMRSGILLITWGLFKKVVVANRFALYADQVFNNVHNYSGLPLIIGIYAYAFQIYFDFSAYTDMARGVGRMFGINLTENFNSPYLATSIADFWRRWHISFSRWILDYIFKPLQMGWRNLGQAGTAGALLITFLISGIWHGPTWGFVIWGALHGLYLAMSTYYRPYQNIFYKKIGLEKSRFRHLWQIMVTFNLVSFAWIFFRSNELSDACYIVLNIFKHSQGIFLTEQLRFSNCVFLFIGVIFYYSFNSLNKSRQILNNKFRWVFYYVLFIVIYWLGLDNNSFIYFKF